MKILEELYCGNIRLDVPSCGRGSSLAELACLRERNREKLLESLNESEKETFEKFTDTQSEMNDITQYQKFAYGFKLGVLLMAEASAGAEEGIESDT